MGGTNLSHPSMTPSLLTDYPRRRYLTYPHSNGFAAGGRLLVLGQQEGNHVSFWAVDVTTGSERLVGRHPVTTQPQKLVWFDIAVETDELALVAENTLWLHDLRAESQPRLLYKSPTGMRLDMHCGISRDGHRVIVAEQAWNGGSAPERSRAVYIDTHSGHSTILFEKPWWMDHMHFCGHDENWIGFSHEGPTHLIPDRVWAWHAVHAPEGRCCFDQRSDAPEQFLYVGHERWAMHATSALAVAYGFTAAGPTGLYKVYPDARPARLISASNRDLHCNISPDGRFAVVDTTGPHDAPGKGWENSDGKVSDIVLVDMSTGRRTFLARSRIGKSHPCHPHPVFSPDGNWLYYNEADESGAGNRVHRVALPELP